MVGKDSGAGSGLLDSIRKLVATLVGILQTRLEILATELEEAKLQLGQQLLMGLVALFCVGLGIVLLAVFFVVLFWDSHRLAVLGMMAGFFLGAGAIAVLVLRARAVENTKMFAGTLAELAKDREQLK